MAVEFNVPGTRTSENRFLPEHITIDPAMNGRHELPDIAKPGKITQADVKRESPSPKKESSPSLKNAIAVMIAECDTQPDVMVFEIHKDTINAIREAAKRA